MPLLVRSPEEIFRETRRDIYILRSQEEDDRQRSGLAMILNWVKQELPGTHMELIAPSECSGIIEGGINGSTWVDFSPQGLERFCKVWEREDGGSIDPRFQCYLMPYDEWFEGHGRFEPTRSKPQAPGVSVWWYTLEGFIHHTLSKQEWLALKEPSNHPANQRDIWVNLTKVWPEMMRFSPDRLTYGGIDWVRQPGPSEVPWRAWYYPPFGSPTQGSAAVVPSDDQIRAWFCLPGDTPVIEWMF